MRLMRVVLAATVPLAAATAMLPVGPASAAPSFLAAPTYSSTLVGSGLASMYPVDVTQDSSYYFVLDAGRYRVVAVTRSTGAIACQIGGLQGSGPGQFGDARALDYDATHNELYVADTPNNRVEVFSFSASLCASNSSSAFTFLSQFGTKGSGPGQFNQAYGVAVDPVDGWVYAVNGAGWVQKWTLTTPTTPSTYVSQFNGTGLNEPRQVTVAPNHDVLVMNARDHECDVFSSAGSLLFTIGNGQGTGPGQFTDDPRGVSVSENGNLAFITDSGGKRIEVFNLQSNGTNYTGWTFAYTISSGTGANQFVGPRGLTTTSDNHLLLTDEWGFSLHELSFTPTGATVTRNLFGTAPPLPGVNSPRGLQIAANGQIYMVDYWNQRIEYMDANGSAASSFGFRGNPSQKGAINFAWSAAFQPGTGDVFVANRESNQVEVFSPTGSYIYAFGKNGTGNEEFKFPQGIAFDPTNGTLLVDDSGNDRIQRFTMSAGDTSAKWDATYGSKGMGKTAPPGGLNNPTGIAVAPDGTIWVADTLNNRIQSLSPSGTTWTVFTTTTGSGQQLGFKVPWGVSVAPDGSIWVADTGNNRIVSMSTTGVDNFSATAASMGVPAAPKDSLIYPFAIAFSGDTVFLSDIWNNRVLVLTTH